MKLLVIISFTFLLGACGNSPKVTQGESIEIVDELSIDWHQKLQQMYNEYDNEYGGQIEPGILPEISYEESNSAFPWVEYPGIPLRSELEDWAKKATFTAEYDVFRLEGKYTITEDRIVKDVPNVLSFYNEGDDSLKIVSHPVWALGELRIRLTSHVTDREGRPVTFREGDMRFGTDYSNFVGEKQRREFSIDLKSKERNASGGCKGYLDIEFFRADTSRALVLLGKTNEGRVYQMDTTQFSLLLSGPGDMILGYSGDWPEGWNIIPVMGGQWMYDNMEDQCREYHGYRHNVLYYYNHPHVSFGEYLVEIRNVDLAEMKATPDMIRRAAKGIYVGTLDDIRAFHEAAGAWIGGESVTAGEWTPYSGGPGKDGFIYDDYKNSIVHGYEMAEEVNGDMAQADSIFYVRRELQTKAVPGDWNLGVAKLGMRLYSRYYGLKLKPDWAVIEREARRFVSRWGSSSNREDLQGEYLGKSQYMYDYVGANEPIPLTEEDIDYLCTHNSPEPEKDKDGKCKNAVWFKTNMNTDSVYVFPSYFNWDKESLKLFQARIELVDETAAE